MRIKVFRGPAPIVEVEVAAWSDSMDKDGKPWRLIGAHFDFAADGTVGYIVTYAYMRPAEPQPETKPTPDIIRPRGPFPGF